MKKSELYGMIGSAIFCGIVLLLLLLIVMPGRPAPEDEGIIVSFGDSFEGGGQSTATNVSTPVPTPQAEKPTPPAPVQPEQPAPAPPTPQDLLTQDDHSLALAQQKEEEEKRQKELEEQKRREEAERIAEAKRMEEERLAEEHRIAEQKRKEQEAIEKANALGNMFGSTNANPEGSGSNEGNAQQGNPVGKGSSEGNSWSLDGRSLIGKLAKPVYESNVEGVVTVSIRVDENGNVTSVSICRPTTISDAVTQKATLDAARKTKFSAGKNIAAGTITYNFKLK